MWRRWRRRPANADSRLRAEQEALLRSAQRQTEVYEHLADNLAELPADEFAARIRDALTLRPR